MIDEIGACVILALAIACPLENRASHEKCQRPRPECGKIRYAIFPGIPLRLFKNLLMFVLLPSLLSGCCMFGYEQDSHTEWVGGPLTDVAAVKAVCEREVEQAAERAEQKFSKMVAEECAEPKPFASIVFVNPSNGRKSAVSAEQARAWEEALCPEWKVSGKVSAENLSAYCQACQPSYMDKLACYQKNDLHMEEQKGIRCKSMRLF